MIDFNQNKNKKKGKKDEKKKNEENLKTCLPDRYNLFINEHKIIILNNNTPNLYLLINRKTVSS